MGLVSTRSMVECSASEDEREAYVVGDFHYIEIISYYRVQDER